jgi:predicted nucleic acid-binding protein
MRPEPLHYIFDATVLSAFCVVGALGLLERRYAGRAHWAIEVQEEILRGVATVARLSDVLVATWLGEPLRCLAVDEIEKVRLRLGGRSRDRRHLGDAATTVIAKRQGWIVATDDRDAMLLARAEGAQAIGTIAILRACVRDGYLRSETAKELLDEMIDVHGRRLPEVSVEDLS